MKLSINDFLFGIPDENYSSINFDILYAKYYIFSSKYKNNVLSFPTFQKKLEFQKELEKKMHMEQNRFILSADGQRSIEII